MLFDISLSAKESLVRSDDPEMLKQQGLFMELTYDGPLGSLRSPKYFNIYKRLSILK